MRLKITDDAGSTGEYKSHEEYVKTGAQPTYSRPRSSGGGAHEVWDGYNPMPMPKEDQIGHKTGLAVLGMCTVGGLIISFGVSEIPIAAGCGLGKGVGGSIVAGGSMAANKGAEVIERASEAVKYGPMNKGPLPDAIANTFRSGTYTKIVTQEETTLYRVYGGKAGQLSSYWTTTKPQGPVQSIIDSALNPSWGNNATKVVSIYVPKGTTIYQGFAASQGDLVGGGVQVYIERVNPSWIVK